MENQNSANKDARIKLIDTATKLFAEKGFAAVSIREVAEAAQVNSSMISYYFGGKESLYETVIKTQLEKVHSHLAKLLDNQLPPLERLQQYAQGIYEAHHASPYLVRFMYSEMNNPTKAFQELIKPFISKLYITLYHAIRDGQETGQIKTEIDPSNAAISLAAILNFYFIAKPMVRTIVPIDHDENSYSYMRQAIEIYLNGVKRDD